MNKEELESKFDDCFDATTRASEGGYGADTTSRMELWESFHPVISEFAKQQSVAFFKFCFPTPPDFDAIIERRYDKFIENQFIEQQNK